MVAPVNRLPKPAAGRASALDDAASEALAAVRQLLTDGEPKVVLAAAKIILDFEKARARKPANPEDPPAEQFEEVRPVPQVSDPQPAPEVQAKAEPKPQPRPVSRPAPLPEPPPAPLAVTGKPRGVKPSIASFLPPKLTAGPPVAPTDNSG